MGYQHTCLECKQEGIDAKYYGESGKNGYSRGLEHQDSLRLRNEGNALYKHCVVQHEGRKVDFLMEVTGTFRHNIERQANEGVRVRESKANIVMNSKAEFHQPPITRVVIMRGNRDEQQERRGGNEEGPAHTRASMRRQGNQS